MDDGALRQSGPITHLGIVNIVARHLTGKPRDGQRSGLRARRPGRAARIRRNASICEF